MFAQACLSENVKYGNLIKSNYPESAPWVYSKNDFFFAFSNSIFRREAKYVDSFNLINGKYNLLWSCRAAGKFNIFDSRNAHFR